jgi:hypothetical protein
MSRRAEIVENKREHPIGIVDPSDFTASHFTEIGSELLVSDPRYSLYCFDFEKQEALFVEYPDPDLVERAPFLYPAQAEHATAVVRMPLGEFHSIAEEIDAPQKDLILIHSVGRCGSTLLSKAFQAIQGVRSLSEPDELTQLTRAKTTHIVDSTEAQRLLESSCRWRCKPDAASPKKVALKFRSEVLVLSKEFAAALPRARHIFLYRDGLAWMKTLFKMWPAGKDVYDYEINQQIETNWGRMIPLISETRIGEKPRNAVQTRMLAWVACMEEYLTLRDAQVPLIAARYEDILIDPKAVLRQIFEFCDIKAVDWLAMDEVLGRDSQAGTLFDRDIRRKHTGELGPALEKDVLDLIATRPLLKVPDVILPGTVSVQ